MNLTKERLETLLAAHKTFKAVAGVLGVPVSTVTSAASRHGVRNPGARLANLKRGGRTPKVAEAEFVASLERNNFNFSGTGKDLGLTRQAVGKRARAILARKVA